ncbi:unnamed protein product [marine sediment metagenome]|uniref:Uncharacterized protein n=1 Tax=marine sediment metagenome TaxID=412755 RepID=X0WYS2_9ZZZZ
MSKSNKEPQKLGIASLPTKWSVAVQLIGTFGLAVFLVLYYLFFMGPEENKRYDELNTSINELNMPITKLTEKVENLAKVVKDDQIILKENQSILVEDLFARCVAYKIADLIIEYKKNQDVFPTYLLQQKLENTLIIDTKLAIGLVYENGLKIAEVIKDKILKSKIAEHLATYADIEDYEILMALRDELNNQFRSEILVVIRR